MKKRSHYYKRILLFVFLIIIVPLSILDIIFFFNFSRQIEERINRTNGELLVQTKQRVELSLNEIKNYYTSNGQFFFGDYTNWPMEFTSYSTIIDIKNRLTDSQSYLSLIESAYMINNSKNWIIGNDGIEVLDIMENRDIIEKSFLMSGSSFWHHLENPPSEKTHFSISRQIPFAHLFYFMKLPIGSTDPDAAIVVNISTIALTEALPGNRIFLIDSQSSLAGRGNPTILQRVPDLHDKLDQDSSYSQPAGILEYESEGILYYVSYIRSEIGDWYFISLDSEGAINEQLFMNLFMTFLIIVLAFSIIIFITIKGTGNLDHSILDMEVKLSIQKSHQRELFLLKLVTGATLKIPLLEWLTQLELDHERGPFHFVSIRPEKEQLSQNEFSLSLILNELNDDEELAYPFILSMMHRDSLVALLKNPGSHGESEDYENDKKWLFEFLSKMQKKINEKFNCGIIVGISNPFSQWSQTQMAYQESHNALLHCFNEQENAILFNRETLDRRNTLFRYPQNLEQDLLDSVTEGDRNQCQLLLTQYKNELDQTSHSRSDLQFYFMRLSLKTMELLQDWGEELSALKISSQSLYNTSLDIKSVDQLFRKYQIYIMDPLLEIISMRKKDHNQIIIDKMLELISQNYDLDITLEWCAGELHYHPAHLGKLFKMVKGLNLREYLLEYRLTEAKNLLRHNKFSINEIAEKLRYTNTQNFIRYFKKLEGVTPGQYRSRFR